MSDAAGEIAAEAVAVLGMSGRFPGAADLDGFWRNLQAGVESISFFSDEELRRAGVDPGVRHDPRFVGAGGVLADVDLFDASFFGFNAREAEVMDPQQRLFLECAWEAFENAGYDPGRAGGAVGVFAGTGISTYFFNLYQHQELMSLLGGHQVMIGNDKDHLTTHVSYKLDLRGPSLAVQSACSTSLVAICVACRSLLDYQCDLALAGGSSIALPQGRGYFHREGGIASPDGHCRAFDAGARGTVAGNGVGVVLLKRLADALGDGDPIRAVILGSAVNNDGSNKVGYTAPSVDGQAEVVAGAQAVAAVDPATITYVEAHGTGTPLGDPIEIAALAEVFRGVGRRNQCAVGSVKSNIGHLDTAAGVAGFIKAVLALEQRTIPATLHVRQPSPKLQLDRTPFYLPAAAVPWETNGCRRRAGVSSFGIGGTNAHLVLEEAPPRPSSGPSRRRQLLVLSAPTASGLEALAARHADHLETHPEVELPDAAYTLLLGRKAFRHRRALVCRDRVEAVALLRQSSSGQVRGGHREARHRPVVFMFSGQGAQHPGMAAGLYREEPVFRQQLDACLDLLAGRCGLELRPALYPEAAADAAAERQLAQTALAQPALFAVEYSLARLWMSWGIAPTCLVGHSIGEWVAACLAGVLPLEQALELVALRGRLVQGQPPGAMLAVSLPERELAPWLEGELSLAAVNADDQCVLSGPEAAIEEAATALHGRGVAAVRLRTSHAFHSRLLDPILDSFADAVARVELRPPAIPIVSNLSGNWLSAAEATDPRYWARHLRSTVRFADGLERALAEPDCALLEVGPGGTLAGLARRHRRVTADTLVVASLPSARADDEDDHQLLDALARLWAGGFDVDWPGFYAGERRARVPLPTYPFERKRYWIDPPVERASEAATRPAGRNPDLSAWLYAPTWTRSDPVEPAAGTGRQRWLLFEGDATTTAAGERLRALGHEVTRVRAGAGWDEPAPGVFTIRPDHAPDYAALLRRWRPDGEAAAVLHGWSLTGESPSFDEAQRLGFWSLLNLAAAWSAQRLRQPLSVTVAWNRGHRVLAADAVDAAKATLLGPVRVVPQEHPQVRMRTVDLGPAVDSDPAAVDTLVAECLAPLGDVTVAYRGGSRWIEEFRATVAAPAAAGAPSLLRPRGVYLITGGFGNVGLTLAESLAKRCGARLALLGRSTAGHEPAVRALEALGAEVLVLTADVADEPAMRAALERVDARFGELHGVIHAAGALGPDGFRAVADTTPAVAAAHFAPKAHGVQTLARVLAGRPLDFCMLTSSLSSVLGGLRFAAYAAANAYLDAFVEERNREPAAVPWISVAWDGWRFGEGGQPPAELYLTPGEGAELFHRILARPRRGRLVVSTGDLEQRLRRWVFLQPAQEPNGPPAPVGAVHQRPDLDSSFAMPRTAVEQTIADVWEAVLGLAGVGVHDNFFELGGHSLLAIQLISRLRDLFETELALTTLFERPTIAELAAHIEATGDAEGRMRELERMIDYVEQLSPDEVQALLDGEQGSTFGEEALRAFSAAPAGRSKAGTQQFYDAINSQLSATVFGDHAAFLNYGYVADGSPGESPVELPRDLVNRASVQLVLELIGDCDLGDARVLDVGCGRGGTLLVVERYFRAAARTGVDLSSAAIHFCRRARGRSPQTAFLVGDAEQLPLAGGAYDVVTNVESSHSYPDLDSFYREVHRVLRPGGRFLYTDVFPADRFAANLALLRGLGFRLERQRDITGNVVRSCSETSDRRKEVFAAVDETAVIDDFLAAPGSTVFEEMRSGRAVYAIVRLRKE